MMAQIDSLNSKIAALQARAKSDVQNVTQKLEMETETQRHHNKVLVESLQKEVRALKHENENKQYQLNRA